MLVGYHQRNVLAEFNRMCIHIHDMIHTVTLSRIKRNLIFVDLSSDAKQ